MRELDDKPKAVYKMGFIRQKEKVTAREVQSSPEIDNYLLR
jgi:hypothetical protein